MTVRKIDTHTAIVINLYKFWLDSQWNTTLNWGTITSTTLRVSLQSINKFQKGFILNFTQTCLWAVHNGRGRKFKTIKRRTNQKLFRGYDENIIIPNNGNNCLMKKKINLAPEIMELYNSDVFLLAFQDTPSRPVFFKSWSYLQIYIAFAWYVFKNILYSSR